MRVERCGVCHSDLHMQDGYFRLGAERQLDVRAGRTLPFTLGHEIAGMVEAVGEGAGAPPPATGLRSTRGSAATPVRRAGAGRKTSASHRAFSASMPMAALPRMCWCRIRAT